MTTTRTGRVLAVCLVTAVLGLAGCSSDGSDGSTAGGSGNDRSTTTTLPPGDTGAGATGKPLAAFADYQTKSYDDPAHWVCRPDADDICDSDLDSTTVAADGTLTEVPFEADPDAPIDCFYVYPTISRDETSFSDWDASPDEEGYVTLNQAARLQSQCRLFAPVYRQATLTGLIGRLSGAAADATQKGDPYADVLDAFKTYLAEDNGGRGFVLIGHSQGAGILNRLIQEEIDPNEDLRALLVSAYLAGTSVAVPEGEVVGGDFTNVPLCTADDETGCVVTWASFRSTATPPPTSYFGRPREGDGVSGCVNPASVTGGEAELHAYFPAQAEASILGGSAEAKSWVDPKVGTVETPYVSVPGLLTGECATTDGFTYLSVTVHPDPDDPRADDIGGDLTAEWGLHLVDVNMVMGDVEHLVAEQAAAYAG